MYTYFVVGGNRVNGTATSNCKGEEFKGNHITTLRGQCATTISVIIFVIFVIFVIFFFFSVQRHVLLHLVFFVCHAINLPRHLTWRMTNMVSVWAIKFEKCVFICWTLCMYLYVWWFQRKKKKKKKISDPELVEEKHFYLFFL